MNSIQLNVDIREIYKLNQFINQLIQKEDLNVTLITEEIFVNIVNYSKTDYIKVTGEYSDSILTIEFIDNGIEFNPLLKEDYDFPDTIEDAEIGGLGIYLTKNLADELDYHYANGENHLKIIKKV